MKDTNGVEIKVGDYILFAVVHDRTSRLRYGRVTKINDKTVSAKSYSVNQRRIWGKGNNYKLTYYVEELKGSAFSYPELKSLVIDYSTLPLMIREYIEGKNEE